MSFEQAAADRLHKAIEALLARRPLDDVARALPGDERSLLGAVERLARLRPGTAINPSPTFVLGLEQQLRTDLSLMDPRRSRPDGLRDAMPARLVAAAVITGAALLLGAILLSFRSDAPISGMRTLASWGASTRAGHGGVAAGQVEAGRRALDALRGGGDRDPELVRARVAEVVAAFGDAIQIARASGTPDDRSVVRDECQAAARDLDRMADSARARGAVAAVWLAEGAAALQRRVAAAERLPGGLPTVATPSTTPAAPSPAPATATGVAAVPATPVGAATTALGVTPTPRASASPTAGQPATQTPQPVLEPPVTPVPPRPTATVMPWTTLVPAPGPGPIEPTNTPDRWPATSTPLPHLTDVPPSPAPTQVRPTEPPAPTIPAPTPRPAPGGVHGGRAAPPSR